MKFDAIHAVETLYRTDLTAQDWLLAVMKAMQPLLDPQHRGVHGGFYDCPDVLSFTAEQPVTLEFDSRLRAIFDEGMQSLGTEFIAGTFLASAVVRGASVEGWDAISTVRDGGFRAHGLADVLNLVAVEPDGSGCGLSNFRSAPAILSGSEGQLVRGLFRHFMAAHRLLRTLRRVSATMDGAVAVFDGNARLHHARGAATSAVYARLLSAATQDRERSRGCLRRNDPHGALDAWQSLVADRWTLVDHFDHDGRRYILALENARPIATAELLTPRERDVVQRALEGADNKVIAYDLGIAHSTVKVLIARAAAKLGVRSRRELLLKLRAEHREADSAGRSR